MRTMKWMRRMWLLAAGSMLCLCLARATATAQEMPAFDLKKADEVSAWTPLHDVAALTGTPEGLRIDINGDDPYIAGPARDFPPDKALWMRIRLKSEQSGTGQIFYFTEGPTEEKSVHFPVRPGVWEDLKVPMPALGPGTRLRFDPPGTGGSCVLASIMFSERTFLKEPEWPRPEPVRADKTAIIVESGSLTLRHGNRLGEFTVEVGGQMVASGHTRPLIGYQIGNELRWLDLGTAKSRREVEGKKLNVIATAGDADGATWTVRETLSFAKQLGAVDITVRVNVDRDRKVAYLPMFLMLPGAGSFGETKSHALFSGLEYLDGDEPSSSEKDIIGPGSHRQVPDTLRITQPLMAIQANDRYVGLIWDSSQRFSALFDSPDRLFHSGGHVMGVLFPGSNGANRVEGSLLPYDGETLRANSPLILRVTVIGGKGSSVIPAVQQYVALRGLPAVPKTGYDRQSYAALASAGWLDSGITENGRFRHAFPGRFAPQPAADAALMMNWLALQTDEPNLAQRLRVASEQALSQVDPNELSFSGVSHVRYPVGALVYGKVVESAERASSLGHELLGRFEPDGSVLFHKSPDGLDYGRTHFAPDANGLTAQVVMSLLDNAVTSGDEDLIRAGLRYLRALDKFMDSAPRGAQTWEVPLHTPDILASADLVRAYTLGYQLTGDRKFLESAKYWAWTGVPFTYLINPTGQPVGPYATTPVFGATQWVAPNWMGLPVQWCGLVYSDALYRLNAVDGTGPWKQIADGITASGVQQTWPLTLNAQRVGLLPDSFNLRPQTRNDAAINPGTVLANATRLFTDAPLYDLYVSRANGWIVHAPGPITNTRERSGSLEFAVHGWPQKPYYLLAVGFKSAPKVLVNGKSVALTGSNAYVAKGGRLILKVSGAAVVKIAGQ